MKRFSNLPSQGLRHAAASLFAAVLAYSALAGFRTVTDTDTGWQLASGRYIVQHHTIPFTDVLSYTARGQEWIYPPLAEIVLYGLYVLGGFVALSWLNSAACVATIALALAAELSLASMFLAVLAIPSIAARTAPRADLFTTVLFAALLVVLWRHFRGQSTRLWLIPVLILVWANAHPGFIAGLALLAAYVAIELLECLFPVRRSPAIARLGRAAPWLLIALPATLCNRWGWNIYATVIRQEQAQAIHENVIAEWRRTTISFDTFAQALDWRNLNSSYWWLLAAAAIATAVAIKRKQLGAAALLAAFAYLSLRNLRFQALFAIVTIVVAGPFFSGWVWPAWLKPRTSDRHISKSRAKREASLPAPVNSGTVNAWPSLAFLFVCGLLVAIHSYDLISSRAYIAEGEPALFGGGLSSWYPERAAEFVLQQQLPGNIFHEYNMGGFVAFRLGPQYPDYIDGRAIPFGDLLFEQRKVMKQPPDSAAWQEEADQRGINVLIFSLARYWGLGSTHVQQFCTSQAWRPVYLDEEGAVFVRNRPENAALINHLQIDCAKVSLEPSPSLLAARSWRARAELFNFYANAGSILYKLGRTAEAAQKIDLAIQMHPEEPYLHHTRGQLFEADHQLQDAEHEYLVSAHLSPTEANWFSLASLYYSQRRLQDATTALHHAINLSPRPAEYYLYLSRINLASGEANDALAALDSATDSSSHEPQDIQREMAAQIAARRAEAWAKLGDLHQAVGFQQEALTYEPSNAKLWLNLADLYAAQGQGQLEQAARQRAQTLSQPNP